jgi:hypothetical protein
LQEGRKDDQNAPVDDGADLNPPAALAAIRRAAHDHDFAMSCDDRTGALLRTLAAARPGGRVLELGTGAGVSTAWILDGMDGASSLLTIYVIDGLLPQAAWPDGHAPKVQALVETLRRRRDLLLVELRWASGLILATKR